MSKFEENFKVLALVKPQFELEPKYISKGGVVREEELQLMAVKLVIDFLVNNYNTRFTYFGGKIMIVMLNFVLI